MINLIEELRKSYLQTLIKMGALDAEARAERLAQERVLFGEKPIVYFPTPQRPRRPVIEGFGK